MLNFKAKHPDAQGGSALLEAMIAILVFSFGILGLIGLQATSMKVTTAAKDRIDASLVANSYVAAMWADWKNLGDYAEDKKDISAATGLPEATRTTVVNGNQVTVTIAWKSPAGDGKYETSAQIIGN